MTFYAKLSVPLLCAAVLTACAPKEPEVYIDPVQAHCESVGGFYELRQGKAGSVAVCQLPDGRSVDAAALYNASLG
ncbi:MAG: DUF333 domain-containing protein [Paracoccaceae bacterium]